MGGQLPKIRILKTLVMLSFLNVVSIGAAMSDDQRSIKDNILLSLSNRIKIIDLTQNLNSSVPSYDGKQDNFRYETLSTVDKEGYGTGAFFIHEHLGTHIDAPSHFCNTGSTIDKINPNDLLLPAVVIDVREESKRNPDYLLTLEKI
jgi:hypothetical protein